MLGAVLTGLMVLLFLRDWRSVIVVVLNIPFALAGAVVALWLPGQTINLMTLGGLALAVGILVDEATVEIENIHHKMEGTPSVALAVRRGNLDTAVPRLLAMLCVLAVFLPSFFMQGAARALFVPLSLAVGFAMVASYLLSSTFVPVLSAWLLRRRPAAAGTASAAGRPSTGSGMPTGGRSGGSSGWRWVVVPAYLARRRAGDRRWSGRASAWRSSRGSTPGGSSSGSRPRPAPGSRRPRRSPSPRWRRSARRSGATGSRSRSATSARSRRATRSTPSTSGPAARRR